MSQKRIWSYTLPTSLLLICLFQNCSGGSFDVINPALSSNFGSSFPGANGGDTIDPHDPSTTPTPGTTPGATPTPTPPQGATPTPTPPPTGNLPPDPTDAGRRILKVCPSGCTYSLPSAAAAASQDNDIIEVAGGFSYNDCFTISKNNIKVRGVNGRPHLTGKVCGGKSEINIDGAGAVIESFEFSGMSNSSNNGSGIRSQGLGLTVRNCYFHDGQEGILSNSPVGADPSLDSILVENSKFERLGAGGQAHSVYFGAHNQIFVRTSIFLSSKEEGHEFKSRAKNSSVNCSIFASLDGNDSYSLNFPDAGNAEVKNSFVEQGAPSSNSAIIDYGSEHTTIWSVNRFILSNVTVVNDKSGGSIFQVKGTTQFAVSDSVVAGPGNMFGFQSATFTNVNSFPSRSAAGIAAYPATPTPTGCSNIGLSY